MPSGSRSRRTRSPSRISARSRRSGGSCTRNAMPTAREAAYGRANSLDPRLAHVAALSGSGEAAVRRAGRGARARSDGGGGGGGGGLLGPPRRGAGGGG